MLSPLACRRSGALKIDAVGVGVAVAVAVALVAAERGTAKLSLPDISTPATLASLAMATALPVALLIDRLLGEPGVRWHPVVWMGNYLGWAGRHIAPFAVSAGALGSPLEAAGNNPAAARSCLSTARSNRMVFCLGALAWCAGAAGVWALAWLLQKAVVQLQVFFSSWISSGLGEWFGGLLDHDSVFLAGAFAGGALAALLLGLVLKPLLAWAMLRSEVLAVEAALDLSLDSGRQRLAWLVSRDVAALAEVQVRESAIESLAENLNDSVVAPIFWFVLLGLPGAALYRFANTADAMWGYRGERNGRVWEWAGKWAAWADDGFSWIPARITGLLLFAVSFSGGANRKSQTSRTSQTAAGRFGWHRLRAEARRTPSPNSGWPMAAMALVLGVQLGKAGIYTLNANGRTPEAADTAQAVLIAKKAVYAAVLCAFIATVLIAFWPVLP